MKMLDQSVLKGVIGMSQEQIQQHCKDNDAILRITAVDGNYRMSTCDIRPDRINVELISGKVVQADIG